jgi:D-sedoheptulose 7-phosphate isomerase
MASNIFKNFDAMLIENLEDAIEAKQSLLADKQFAYNFVTVAELLVRAYQKGNRLYIAGNGGSAADAQHLAAEFVSKLARDRDPLPAEALTTDSSIITAIGNDYGYDKIFSRQILAKMKADDVFLGITTSGNSPNIIHAVEQCKQIGCVNIVLTGPTGGKVADLADYVLSVPGSRTSTIQESHILICHSLCQAVESRFV